MTIAADLRKAVAEQAKLNARLDKRIAQLTDRCPHKTVVIVRSYYEGSYIDDWDDWHGEERLCLSCGIFESKSRGETFNTLKNRPIARMENSAFTRRLIMGMSFQQTLAYVKSHGYRTLSTIEDGRTT